jgi:glucose/galactose transporter
MSSSKNYLLSITIIGILFFIFGFITWLNGTLIPFLKLACDLHSDAQALLVTFAFYMAYFFLAIPSSFILNFTGYKKGMALGLFVMALGALIFLPAATSRGFGLFLTGLFVQGMGLSLLQTASNPYISVIGPIESAAKRISIMGICNKVAGALSPVILGAIVLKGASEIETKVAATKDVITRNELLQELSNRVIAPYTIMAIVLVILALMIWFSSLPEIETNGADKTDDSTGKSKNSIFQFPHLLLGALCLFLYVGVEVMAGDVIGQYGRSIGMSLDETKIFTSYTLWWMVLGYIVGIATIPKFIKQETALKICAIIGVTFASAAYFTSGYVSIFFIAIMGLANSLMWPAIFPLAIEGLGKFTKIGSAFLVMGIAGGAVIPQIYGQLIKFLPTSTAFFICTLTCYLYILFYAMKGHNFGKKAIAK